MNIGVFGGTFDPPHIGHLIVAEHAREELGLNKILFIPSAISPHKQDHHLSEPQFRLEMVHLAVLGHTFFEPSDVEIKRGGVSYTVDTLRKLKEIHPGVSLTLLVGLDNLAEFNAWKSPDIIFQLASVAVMTRPGFKCYGNESSKKFILCKVPDIEVSSSDIRERFRNGKSIRFLVPKAVESYINFRGLYAK